MREVSQFPWISIKCQDPNRMLNEFLHKLDDVFRKNFPIVSKFISVKRLHKPWMTAEIFQLIKLKSAYFKQFKRGTISWEENRNLKNRLNSVIRNAKRNYYKNCFDNCKNNIRKTWRLIGQITGNSQNSCLRSRISTLSADGRLISDSAQIAEAFSTYFGNIAQKLDSELPRSSIDPLSFIKRNNFASLFLTPVTETECCAQLAKLKNKSNGKNAISVNLLKIIIPYIAPTMTEIINLCFTAGIFPDSLKIAHICPIHKKGDKNLVSNYRPISVLPIFSKILERCFANRL